MEKHPLHIKKLELQKSEEVQASVEKKERQAVARNETLRKSGAEGPLEKEKIPNDPNERIEVYINRLKNVFLNPDKKVRQRNLGMLRSKIYDKLIINRENFPESYFELQKKVAREQGHGDIEITPEIRERMIDTVIEDQKHSLDAIIDYLSSDDATYPAWFKYYAWTQLIKLSQFDKERGEFKKRTDSTVAPFPALHYGPLAAIADLYEQYPEILGQIEPKLRQLREEKNKLRKSLKTSTDEEKAKIENEILAIDQEIEEISTPIKDFDKKFPNLYAELIAKSLAETVENRDEIRGKWVKYNKGDTSAAETLFQSLKGRGTGWCTADGRTTAETQIESGDFYVYYTNDPSGAPTQPRLAIRMEGKERIGEVRGILPHQGVEPLMQEILDKKLGEFGAEADVYRKKSGDMRRLTALESKQERGESLTKEELIFLYEINFPIEGFGYGKDPRIEEIRSQRNLKEDMLVVLDCTSEEIATSQYEITDNTKAYVGSLFPGIFQSNLNPDKIFTSFPEGKIKKYETSIGGKSKEELINEMQEKNIHISGWANDLLHSSDFRTQETQEDMDLVRLTVEDLGFPWGATTSEIYNKAQELGLELCPAEVGPSLRLSYPGHDFMLIAMEQMTDRDGDPSVFGLNWFGDRLALYADDAHPDSRWYSCSPFVFCLRKS